LGVAGHFLQTLGKKCNFCKRAYFPLAVSCNTATISIDDLLLRYALPIPS